MVYGIERIRAGGLYVSLLLEGAVVPMSTICTHDYFGIADA